MSRRALVPAAACAALVALGSPASGYEMDSHYYLRFTLSLAACFDWREAHLIASGDWGMDENASTHAEMNPVQRSNKIRYHAFGHSDARFREYWLRSRAESDLELRLVKLGQFMHFLEDWESHAGYGVRMGHARDTYRGRDPDSLGNSPARNHRMVQSALDHLLATCEDLGRLDVDRDRELVRLMKLLFEAGLLADLFEQSDPDWKRGKLGGLRPEGHQIRAANKLRLEQTIARHFASLPETRVPGDFRPGDPERGIPPSLKIPFDKDGRILSQQSVEEAWSRWQEAAEASPDVVVSIEGARIFQGTGARGSGGWRILIEAENQGQLDSQAGPVDVIVVDSDRESLLGQASQPLRSLRPGERASLTVSIDAGGRPQRDVMIGAFARVGDLSAMNDEDWLMLGDAEEDEPEVEPITELDPPPAGQEVVRFAAPPKMFVVEGAACGVVSAYTSGGDSPAKLEAAELEVFGAGGAPLGIRRDLPMRWSAFSTEAGLVAGKTFECYEPTRESLERLGGMDAGSLEVAVTLSAEGMEPYTGRFPMAPEFLRALLALGEAQ